jgi:H+/Cl- antiporter ClcA
MIASLFSKTRPINYALVLIMLFSCFFLYQFQVPNEDFTTVDLFSKTIVFLLLLLSFFMVNFISLKNTLTQNDNYAILLFLVFILLFPSVVNNLKIVLSNVFLLLALRRLISLKTLNSSKEKIFDASLWIFISAIFHFWSILYIILVFISIIFHSGKEYKNWILPFVSFLCVWILYIATSLLLFDNYSINKAVFQVSFKFFEFKNVYQNMALALFVSIAVLFFASQTIDYQNKPLNMQSSYKQVYFAFLLAVGIYVFSTNKSNDLLIYTFAPLAILGANMFEKMKNSIYKEVSLYLLLGMGLFFFFVQL